MNKHYQTSPYARLLLLLLGLGLSACASNNAPVTYHDGRSQATLNARGTVTNMTYTVKRGDTLYEIAKAHDVALRDLIEANNVSPPYTLQTGQRLTLPIPQVYRVARGDTLYSISRRFAVDMNTLARRNNLRAPFTLQVDQRLQIPNSRTLETPPTQMAQDSAPKPLQPTIKPPQKANTKTPPPRSTGKFAWPVRGNVIIGFGQTGKGQRNDGINIAAPQGTDVKAADDGVVAFADNKLKGFGNLILVKHDGGWITAYAHNNTMLVKRGDTVKRGQKIGTVGSTGNVANPQLHFQIRQNNKPVDPLQHLEATRLSRL